MKVSTGSSQQSFGPVRVFPGLSTNQTNWLYNEVEKLGITDPSERLRKEQEIYNNVRPVAKEMQDARARADISNEALNKSVESKNPGEAKNLAIQHRSANLADSLKVQLGLKPTTPDVELFTAYGKKFPEQKDKILKYVNEGDKEILYELGIEKKPAGKVIGELLGGAAATVGGAIGGLGAMYAAGEAGKFLSRGIYNAVTPKTKSEIDAVAAWKAGETDIKPTRVVDTMLDTPMIQEGGRGAARLGFVGSKSTQMEQAKVFRKDLRKKTYDPAFKAMDEAGMKGDYRILRDKTLERIDKTEGISQSDKRLAKQRANQIFDDHYQWNFGKDSPSMSNLNKEAKTVRNKLPRNFPEGGQAGNDMNIARTAIKDTFKEEVWTKGKEVGFDLKDADIKYGSVAEIMKEGKAAAAKPLLRGGLPFGIIGNVSNAVTPVIGTAVGKVGYKLSEAMQYVPKKIRENAKEFVKSGKAKMVFKQALRETPASILTPTGEDAVKDVNEFQSNKLNTAIATLESGKMPSRNQDPIIYALIKNMTQEEALKELKELQAVRSEKGEFKDGLDYLLKVIEKEAGDSFTPYMKKKK